VDTEAGHMPPNHDISDKGLTYSAFFIQYLENMCPERRDEYLLRVFVLTCTEYFYENLIKPGDIPDSKKSLKKNNRVNRRT